MKCDVDALGLAPCPETKPAALEHLEHRGVIGQDLCNQFFEPRGAGNDGEMVQQFCANPLPLVLVNDNESNFGLPRLHDDLAAAADDQRSPAFLQHGNQGHVADEVDVREEGDFLLREAALHREETPVEREWELVRSTAARRLARSSGLRARISTCCPLRSSSTAE